MWWVWVLAAGLFMLAALLFFLLYRKTKLTLEYRDNPANVLTVDGVAVLIGELEAAGEAIVDRLEAKQREVDQLIQLLDAKVELVQMALAAEAGYEQRFRNEKADANPVCLPEATPTLDSQEKSQEIIESEAAIEAQTKLGDKHMLVLGGYKQGLSPIEIAQKTGLKLDEVRLILNLLRTAI